MQRTASSGGHFSRREAGHDLFAARAEAALLGDLLAILPAAAALLPARRRHGDADAAEAVDVEEVARLAAARGDEIDVRDDEKLRQVDGCAADLAKFFIV